MINFPIDPTPFVIPYAIIVFLCPWIIYGAYLIRSMMLFAREGLYRQHLFNRTEARNEIRKTNPEIDHIYKKAIRWLIITLGMWIIGFTVLGTTLYLMEENNLLINHSKGLYAPNETK